MYCSNCGAECSDLKPRFPVAGIFLILHGLISLYNAMFEKDWHYAYGGWRTVYVGSNGEFFWLALLQFFIIIIAVILLFRKKKDKILIGFLVLYGLINIAACICNIPTYSTYTHTADAAYAGLFENRIHYLVFIVEIISHCGMIFLTIISSAKMRK